MNNLVNPSNSEESINVRELESLLSDYGAKKGIYNLESLKEIELYANLYSNDKGNMIYKQKLYNSLYDLKSKSEIVGKIQTVATKYNTDPNKVIYIGSSKDENQRIYQGETVGTYSDTIFKGIESF